MADSGLVGPFFCHLFNKHFLCTMMVPLRNRSECITHFQIPKLRGFSPCARHTMQGLFLRESRSEEFILGLESWVLGAWERGLCSQVESWWS